MAVGRLDGQRIALLIGPGFEDSEALYPYYRLQEEGARVEVVAVERPGGSVVGKHGVPLTVDRDVAEARAAEYDALVLPGGRGPDAIRTNPDVLRFTRDFFDARKPVAGICHGPQILISADLVRGVRLTGYKSIAQDLKNAGALYEDRETVVDERVQLVTARQPSDLPAWLPAVIDRFAAARAASASPAR
ncbi:MAG: type 1 glutamine amidotransferase domain-containing protein [Bacillota bacterium]|nr:type 1 glutamine amidotransferase domain-containing protein [Bacillota bacterium]